MHDKVKIIKIITVASVIFIILMAISLIINVIKLSGLSRRKAELEGELAAINQAIEENNEALDFMSSDTYVDQYAREYLNLIGKDEKPFNAK